VLFPFVAATAFALLQARSPGLRGFQGLMLPLWRNSVEPLAVHLEPERVSTRHQSLHHFISKSEWSDAALLEHLDLLSHEDLLVLDRGCRPAG